MAIGFRIGWHDELWHLTDDAHRSIRIRTHFAGKDGQILCLRLDSSGQRPSRKFGQNCFGIKNLASLKTKEKLNVSGTATHNLFK